MIIFYLLQQEVYAWYHLNGCMEIDVTMAIVKIFAHETICKCSVLWIVSSYTFCIVKNCMPSLTAVLAQHLFI